MRKPALTARVIALTGVLAAVAACSGGHRTTTTAASNPNHAVQVWLADNEQAAQRFVAAASTPGSTGYRRFLSPAAYTQRFGPSAAQLKSVTSYLNGAGFTHVRVSTNGVYVSATAPASVGKTFTVPASLKSGVLAVTGLGGPPPKPPTSDGDTAPALGGASGGVPCSHYWGQHTQQISPAFQGLTVASTTVCGYSASQIRSAYGLTRADTGHGETIALVEVGGPDDMAQALADYARANGLPAPRPGQFRTTAIGPGSSDTSCVDGASEEGSLDAETAYAMAPAADQLMVYGNDCDTSNDGAEAVLDAMLKPLTGTGPHPGASIESVSYGLEDTGESGTPRPLLAITHSIALRAAAEGVSMLVSSGDNPGVDPPASDPDVTAVGGTTLGIGSHGQRLFETGWSTVFGERTGTSGAWHDQGNLLGGGGGVSAVYTEPAYQQGVVPAAMARNQAGSPGRAVPDVAADADPGTGMRFGLIFVKPGSKTTRYETFRQAGTSTSTPLVAGMVADAEQGQSRSLGFLNPLLYSLAGTRAFHDILPVSKADPPVDRACYARGSTDINHKFALGYLVCVNDAQQATGQVTARGYDTTTGLGTPNGNAFVAGLRSGR